MIRSARFVVALLAALAAFLPKPLLAQNAVSVARAVDDHYNQLRSFKSAFTEHYEAPGISRSESGVLWLKKPGRMRWDYQQPKAKLFLVDSQNAYFYVPGEPQARKTSLKKIDDIRSPLRFLLGQTKLEKELDGLSLAPDVTPTTPRNVVLRGVPKTMKNRVSEVLLEITPAHQIARIVIQGTDDTSTDFRFSQFADNIPIADSIFKFVPPPGVATIQDDQPAQ